MVGLYVLKRWSFSSIVINNTVVTGVSPVTAQPVQPAYMIQIHGGTKKLMATQSHTNIIINMKLSHYIDV